ncbi:MULTISPECIES: hypothetical protein [unclassified Streptomyces]|uniref:hypothetical protein n=1 Tax=unclassified Streptomyces TaxID=2593676 RepID=UPI00278C8361|nr:MULTISPECIES: hypothetical protein [unclassified Streptomyces]
MNRLRERLIAGAILVVCLLLLIGSIEAGQSLVDAVLRAATAYGLLIVLAALGLSLGLRALVKASRAVLVVAVVIGLVLVAIGKSVWAVI